MQETDLSNQYSVGRNAQDAEMLVRHSGAESAEGPGPEPTFVAGAANDWTAAEPAIPESIALLCGSPSK